MLQIAGHTLSSPLLLGTGKYPDFATMRACHEAAETAMVTLAIRRVNLSAPRRAGGAEGDGPSENILDYIDRTRVQLLPNTAGCYTPEDAVLTAKLARDLLETNWIKLEVIGDPDTLFPCAEGTLEAARVLVRDGFIVLPYVSDDPVLCKRLAELGCAAVMPLGAPIGSGLGIRNPYNLRIILEQAKVPILVDAGVGTASDATVAMEMGASGVLLNTAVAGAKDPVRMARAMKHAVEAGILAREAGRIPRKLYANASSPLEGVIGT